MFIEIRSPEEDFNKRCYLIKSEGLKRKSTLLCFFRFNNHLIVQLEVKAYPKISRPITSLLASSTTKTICSANV
ncbi:hypothetical protein DJ94_931 [Bacillus pseudomycoides]|nr:hypothetical protein DJ94_931 [Bacillus pseudomycoides]